MGDHPDAEFIIERITKSSHYELTKAMITAAVAALGGWRVDGGPYRFEWTSKIESQVTTTPDGKVHITITMPHCRLVLQPDPTVGDIINIGTMVQSFGRMPAMDRDALLEKLAQTNALMAQEVRARAETMGYKW